MEAIGYVCNEPGCRLKWRAYYMEEEGPAELPCPSCKTDRTVLPKSETKESTGEKITVGAIKLANGQSYR